MVKVSPTVFSFFKNTIFSEKNEAMTFSSLLVIYSLISCVIYL